MSKTLDLLSEILGVSEPVSFREFCVSPDYCNNPDLYEFWLNHGEELPRDTTELILHGSLGGGKCVHGDTFVLTSNGVRRVKSLVHGSKPDTSYPTTESVFVKNSHQQLGYTYSAGVKDSLKFHLSDGTVFECSPEHRIKVWDNSHSFQWKSAKDIVVGDKFEVDLSPMSINKPTSYLRIDYLTIRHHLHVNEYVYVNEEFGYFLGLMCGDGSYTESPRYESVDPQLYQWVSKYLEEPYKPVNNKRNYYRVNAGFMRPLFEMLGIFGDTADSKHVPDVIINAPFSVQVAYMQGVMDTDGTSDTRSHCEIEMNSKSVLDFIKVVANALGIESRFTKPHTNKSYRLYFSSSSRNKALFRLRRKQERIRDSYNEGYCKKQVLLPGLKSFILNEIKEKKVKLTREDRSILHLNNSEFNVASWRAYKDLYFAKGLGLSLDLNDITAVEVKSIKQSKCEMYDLANPISHSYRANCCVVHNSYFAAYYLAYRVYLLFFGGSPQRQLGLPDNTDIYVLYFSVSLKMAQKSGFSYIYNIFQTCKWFKDNAPINEDKKSGVEFIGKHFFIDYASGEGHQIGLNVWADIMDEANFRSGVGQGTQEQYEEVKQLYQQLLDRQLSRFAKPDGSVDALSILVSSASYQSSFLESRREAIKSNPHAAEILTRAYEVRPEKFSKEKFEVFIGTGAVEPCIVESEEHKKRILQTANLLGTTEEESFFLKVPINLISSFKENTPLALQNHAGIPTSISSSFMTNLRYLYEAYTDIKPVFQSEYLEAATGNDTQLIEYLIKENIVHAERPHCGFLDLSLAKDAGALVFFRYDGKDGRGYDIHTRVFSLHIMPPPFPAQTSVTKVKQFIIDLAGYFNLVAFGSDQFQSEGLRQDVCEALNIANIRISIDSSDTPHLHWQRALVDARIKQSADPVLEREVKESIHDWKHHRVLKAKKSSDDCMQANVGAFYLSDTEGRQQGSIENLYGNRVNLVGGKSITKVLHSLGYQ